MSQTKPTGTGKYENKYGRKFVQVYYKIILKLLYNIVLFIESSVLSHVQSIKKPLHQQKQNMLQ